MYLFLVLFDCLYKVVVLEMLLSVAGLMKRLPGAVIPLLKSIGKYYFSEHNGDSPANLLLCLKMLKV